MLPEQPARGPAHTLEGGREAWEKAGLPVACGRKESLERQVRMVAGSIILCGRVLSLVHGAFPVLPIGAGCGLVFCWCDRVLRHGWTFAASALKEALRGDLREFEGKGPVPLMSLLSRYSFPS